MVLLIGISLVGLGKMGGAIARIAAASYADRIKVVSAVEQDSGALVGSKIPGWDAEVFPASKLEKAVENADVTFNFSTAKADAEIIPRIAAMGKKLVVGTTGFTPAEMEKITRAVKAGGASAVIASNFSPLVNSQFLLARRACELLAPLGYEAGIVEEHHSKKADAPSGTARQLADVVSASTPFKKTVFRAEGSGKKSPGELDVAVLRLGGTPGIHELRLVGEFGRLVLTTEIFSRDEFAKGAIEAGLWLHKNGVKGRVHSVMDVIGAE